MVHTNCNIMRIIFVDNIYRLLCIRARKQHCDTFFLFGIIATEKTHIEPNTKCIHHLHITCWIYVDQRFPKDGVGDPIKIG